MEKARIISLFVVVLHICFISTLALGDDLISHWTFDEGGGSIAYDSAGDNDGTLVSDPVWTTGIIDGALDFDGDDDYVDVGDPVDSSLDFGAADSFSISAWIKTDDENGQIVYKRKYTGVGGYQEGYRLRLLWNLLFGIEDTSGNGISILGDTMVADDQWHHVVAVRDTATDKLYLYLDGSSDATPVTDTTIETLATDRSLEIGRADSTVSPYLSYHDGKIDDVRIYERALSAEEVEELYLEGSSGPIAHWKFDEGEGDIAYDSAGDNDGTLVNGPVWTSGQIDGALDFDGDGDHVDFGDVDEFEFGDSNFAISAWFYGTGVYPDFDGVLVSKYNYDNYGRQWYLKQDEAGYIYFYTSPDGSTHELLTSQEDAYLNQWVHVVGVRDDSTKRLYLNGLLDNTQSTGGVVTGKSSKVYVGCSDHPMGLSRCFNGKIDDVRLYDRALSAEEIQELYEPPLAVAVDIKPGSCPNPLNVSSKGVLPVAILGTEDFDVNSIDAVSILLAGVDPIRSAYEDVARPVSDGNECECSEEDPDGYTDLTLKFKTAEIAEALVNIYGEIVAGDVLTLPLTGVLSDGTPIEGADCVRIVGKVPRALSAKKSDLNEDGTVNMLDFSMMTEYWLEMTAWDEN